MQVIRRSLPAIDRQKVCTRIADVRLKEIQRDAAFKKAKQEKGVPFVLQSITRPS